MLKQSQNHMFLVIDDGTDAGKNFFIFTNFRRRLPSSSGDNN